MTILYFEKENEKNRVMKVNWKKKRNTVRNLKRINSSKDEKELIGLLLKSKLMKRNETEKIRKNHLLKEKEEFWM